MKELLQRNGRGRALSPAQWIHYDLDGPPRADSGCSSRQAVYLEVSRYGHAGRCASLGGLPIARLNLPLMFSTIGVSDDRALLVVAVEEPVIAVERYADLWRAVRRLTDARLHDLGIRAENLLDGRFRPGLLLDPAGFPEMIVQHPRTVIDGARIPYGLYFSPAPLLTAEAWIERAASIADPPPVEIPSPARPRNFFQRLVHGGAR